MGLFGFGRKDEPWKNASSPSFNKLNEEVKTRNELLHKYAAFHNSRFEALAITPRISVVKNPKDSEAFTLKISVIIEDPYWDKEKLAEQKVDMERRFKPLFSLCQVTSHIEKNGEKRHTEIGGFDTHTLGMIELHREVSGTAKELSAMLNDIEHAITGGMQRTYNHYAKYGKKAGGTQSDTAVPPDNKPNPRLTQAERKTSNQADLPKTPNRTNS